MPNPDRKVYKSFGAAVIINQKYHERDGIIANYKDQFDGDDGERALLSILKSHAIDTSSRFMEKDWEKFYKSLSALAINMAKVPFKKYGGSTAKSYVLWFVQKDLRVNMTSEEIEAYSQRKMSKSLADGHYHDAAAGLKELLHPAILRSQ